MCAISCVVLCACCVARGSLTCLSFLQVAFDSAYYGSQRKLEETYETRDSRLLEYQRAILSAGPKAAEDFDSRTALYRQIFSFVMTHAGAQVCVCMGVLVLWMSVCVWVC